MKLLIWGTGSICEKVTDKIKAEDIAGYVASDKENATYKGRPVYPAHALPETYDLLFITDTCGKDILTELKENHISLDKVCFFDLPVRPVVDKTDNFNKCAAFLPDEILVSIPGYEDSETHNFVKRDLDLYNRLNQRDVMRYDEAYKKFIYMDKYDQAGEVRNYFWQDLWAAQLIYKNKPLIHYDIGSRIDGFIAHLLSFRENIVLIDVRPLDEEIPGVDFICADATSLDGIEDHSIESLSALCSLEHFGLGRYGDKIDPEACFKAFNAISRKMAPGGMVYLSVPVGREHVEFNAHRIFYADTIVKAFSDMDLIRFDAADTNKLVYGPDLHAYDNRNESGCRTFGLFQFKKH